MTHCRSSTLCLCTRTFRLKFNSFCNLDILVINFSKSTMFRATQNQFDEAVAKATDENLTSENWELILDVCDKVTGNENGGKDVVAALMKRLSNRNANVQLLALELANALSQNCGLPVHRELASKSFTDSLLRLAGDRVSAVH